MDLVHDWEEPIDCAKVVRLARANDYAAKSTASTYLCANRMRPALEIPLLVDVYPSTSTATVSGRLAVPVPSDRAV